MGVIAISISSLIGLLGAITANINQIRYQNKAVALLADLETTLAMKHFDTVYRWVQNPGSPHVIYYWDEYQNPDDPDNSSLTTVSSELEGRRSKSPPNADELRNSEGEVYRVLVSLYQNGLKGKRVRINDNSEYSSGALGGDASSYALSYLPVKVEILVDPRDDIANGSGDETTNEQRRVYEDVMMKMR